MRTKILKNARGSAGYFFLSTAVVLFTIGGTATAQNTNANANSAAAVSSPTPTPTPIPISSIVSQADAAAAKLREIRAFLDSSPDNFEINARLGGVAQFAEERAPEVSSILAGRPSLDELTLLENDWQSSARTIDGWKTDLQSQATELDKRIKEVRDLSGLWQRSVESFSGTGETVPAEALRRANETTFVLGEFLKDIERRRADLIALQSKVSDLDTQYTTVISSIRARRSAALGRLFVQDSPVIWNAETAGTSAQGTLSEAGNSVSARWADLRAYAAGNVGRFIIHGIVIVLLALALSWAGRRIIPLVEKEPKLERAANIFRHPIAAALLLSIFLSGAFYFQAPKLLSTLLGLAMLVPVIFLLRRIIDKPLHVVLYVLVGFYFFDRVRELASGLVLASRLLFLAEMLVAVLLLIWFLRSKRIAAKVEAGNHRLFMRVRQAVPIAIAVFGSAFIANLLGFVNLSAILGNGVLRSAYAALILYTAYEVLKGVVMFALRMRPFSALTMVKNNRTVVRIRVMQIIRWIVIGLWLLIALNAFSVRDAVFTFIGQIFSASFDVGSLTISAGHIFAFLIAVWIAFLISRLLRFVLEEDVYPRIGLSGGVSYAISTMVHYAILVVGFLLAIAALGFELTQFAFIAGAVGLGLGFGLQNIINNFVSGLILLFERPVKVGDMVQIGEHQGRLSQIGLRASVLRKVDGSDVIVPNSQLISEEVINWTMSDDKRRIDIPVGVAYGTDPHMVLKLLADLPVGREHILAEPAPRALFIGLGESSLDFELRFWTTDAESWVPLRSEMVTAVHDALTQADIEIPFPNRDVHIQSVNAEVAKMLKGSGSV